MGGFPTRSWSETAAAAAASWGRVGGREGGRVSYRFLRVYDEKKPSQFPSPPSLPPSLTHPGDLVLQRVSFAVPNHVNVVLLDEEGQEGVVDEEHVEPVLGEGGREGGREGGIGRSE